MNGIQRMMALMVLGSMLAAVMLPLPAGRDVLMTGGSPEEKEIPIIMYHHILEEPSLLGDYVISPGQLESDLNYLKEHGYTAVLPRDLVAYVNGTGELPEKPVMITFDDGNKSALVYAVPLLKEYGMNGVVSIIGIHSEEYSEIADANVRYASATWSDIRDMADSGVIEIGNHTYDMHDEQVPRRGTLRKPGEGVEEYQQALLEDLELTQELLRSAIGFYPAVFAYPFGFIDPDADPVLERLGFQVTFGVEEKVDSVRRGDPDSLKKLGRFNRPHAVTTESFFQKMGLESLVARTWCPISV